MQEEIIKFETAKLAKEKGFDLEVSRSYNKSEKLDPFDEYDASLSNYNELNKFTSAPTQSLLQKWLRDKHNIDITINCDYNNILEISYYDYYIVQEDCSSEKEYNTYEEALENAIKEVLNLI